VAGVQLFEDQLPSGISVTYFVDEQVRYVGVVLSGDADPSSGIPQPRRRADSRGRT
jgi:hypothetical protein